MKLRNIFAPVVVLLSCVAVFVFKAGADDVVATQPVFVPDTTHQNDPLPDGILAWDSLQKTVTAKEGDAQAHFAFNFTNISGGNVVILDVHPSCGCTTAELPQMPWMIVSGTNGQIGATVNLTRQSGMFVKSIDVKTDKGQKKLLLTIQVDAVPARILSEAEREAAVLKAKEDRQAVFRDDCASCHVKNGEGKYGQELYAAACAICHESERRALFVPDLHKLKVPTNRDFWLTWIAHGKPGSLMPAFSQADGGPLTEMQIQSLVAYLTATIPSKEPSAQ